MNLSRFLKGFVLSFVLFTLMDAVWHGGMMSAFYDARLTVINPGLNGAPAFSPFILLLEAVNAAAITYFVLATSTPRNALANGAWVGGFLGFTVIGSVNGLNHVLIAGWDATLVAVDTAWGTAAGLVVGIAVSAFCVPEGKRWLKWFRR